MTVYLCYVKRETADDSETAVCKCEILTFIACLPCLRQANR